MVVARKASVLTMSVVGAVVSSQARAGGVGRVCVAHSCAAISVRVWKWVRIEFLRSGFKNSLPTRGSSLLATLELCGPALVEPWVVPVIGAPVDIGPWPVVWEVFEYPVSWPTVWVPRVPSRPVCLFPFPSKSESDVC